LSAQQKADRTAYEAAKQFTLVVAFQAAHGTAEQATLEATYRATFSAAFVAAIQSAFSAARIKAHGPTYDTTNGAAIEATRISAHRSA
jgi:hypothetical protein